jgi:SNF2 family DNA or RNA helicase
VLTKRAIRLFLERPRKDYSTWKKLSDDELEKKQRQLCEVRPPIWSKLDKSQKVCFLLGVKFKRFAIFNDTGTGKSFLSIALRRYFRATGIRGIALVLVPNKSNKSEWEREILKHSPTTPYCVLRGSSKQKWAQFSEFNEGMMIETYAGLTRMLCELKETKKKRNRLKPDKKAVKLFASKLCGLFLDESTKAKNWRKLPFRICRQLAKKVHYLFPLSGTPFGRDPIDFWAQMFLVDGGYTLGETLGLFRAAFFTESLNEWGITEYTFNPKKEILLHRFLANRSISYEAKGLPKVDNWREYVSLPDDAEIYYAKARDQIISSSGNYREMKNAFLRMRQISSGFLGYRDDETGERARFQFYPKPKLQRLFKVMVPLLGEPGKVIVYHEFIFSGDLICRELKERGLPFLRLYGKTKNADEILDQFANDPKSGPLILNNAAGGYGLNLQPARTGIYYESPVGVILRRQTERRYVRQHSKFKWVNMIDMVTRGTVDEQILEYHEEGGSLFKAIVRGEVRPL